MARKNNTRNKNNNNPRILGADKYTPSQLNANYQGNAYNTHDYDIQLKHGGLGIAAMDANSFVRNLLKTKRKANTFYQVVYETDSGLLVYSKFDETQVIPDFTVYGLESEDFTITNIRINSVQMPSKTGGFDDHNNDCLYYAVKYALNDKAVALIKTPPTWKKWVNIGRKDMIDYRDIPIIEDKIKCRINVVGDYIYQSPKEFSRVIQVTLKDGHYRFKNNMEIRKHLVKYKSYNRKLVYFESVKKNTAIRKGDPLMRLYDGLDVTEQIFAYSDLTKSKTHSYVEHKGDTLINEAYDKFMNDCTHFKQLTSVDLADYDHSVTDLCLSLFYKYNMCFEHEPMDEFETATHLKCRRGGLMFADTVTSVQDKELSCYDINSSYPSVMIKHCSYPYTKPEYSILADKPATWGLGLFHAKIHNIDMRLMSCSQSDWYSSVDLNRATELGYEIELIQDGEINSLQYKKFIVGTHLFGAYINDMYVHKNTINELTGQKNPIFKQVMNCLHGLLAQRDKKYYTNSDTGKPFETHHPMHVTIKKDGEQLVVKSQSSIFKRPYARIQTFITAHARTKISKLVEPIKASVYRIQTDSFLTTADNIAIDNEIGGLKLEYSGNYKIEHVNKILCITCGKPAKVCSVLGCC
jgi:hypothetical protein